MRKIIILLISGICHISFSQVSIKLSNIDNGGGNFQSGNISILSTIGEVSINEYTVNALKISEGFIGKHQLNNQSSQNLNCVTPPNDLISWWAAEDNTTDSVGNNDGASSGGVSYTTGVVNKAFLFDGIDDVVVVPHSPDLDITGDITVEFWALQTVFNAENTVLCKGSEDAENTFSMRFSGQTFQCVFKDDTGTDIVLGGPSFEDFQWHHYAYIRQGNQHIIYADGFNLGWESFTNSPESSAGLPLTIGAQYNNQNSNYVNFFGGQIDEISVYNRALTETEIQNIFNARTNGKCGVPLNIEDSILVENNVKLYPNPVIDELTINFNKSGSFNVWLYDMNGKVLNTIKDVSSTANINMVNKASGLYFVSVQNRENYQNKVFKIIKK